MRVQLSIAVLACLLVSGCGEQEPQQRASAPAPVEITRDDIGHYCNMIVVDHLGPKGQIHIAGREAPIWFSSVRDTIVFTLLPEEPKNITAIYVNDMGRASWRAPEAGTWIDAREAWFVVGSDRAGGMGAPEAVPFSGKADAEAFAERHGGQVVAFDGVPEDYVLNDASESMHSGMQHGSEHAGMQHGSGDAAHDSHAMPLSAGADMPMHEGHDKQQATQ